MRRRVEYHPAAIDEAAGAFDWYLDDGGPRVAQAFEDAVRSAVDEIASSPSTWPRIGSTGDRKYVVKRFPFVVIFDEHEQAVRIKAIADARRRPGYWRSRSF